MGWIQERAAADRYWYMRTMPGLILDRTAGSVSLEATLHQIRERPRQTSPRAAED